MALDKPEPSLLGIPFEIRQHILKQLLCCDEAIYFGPRPDEVEILNLDDMLAPRNDDASQGSGNIVVERYLDSPHRFSPQILSTCSQLHREGHPLLYGNRVAAIVEVRWPPAAANLTILGHRYGVDSVPKAITTYISRLTIEVLEDSDDFGLGHSRIDALQRKVSELAKLIARTPAWTDLEMTYKGHHDRPYENGRSDNNRISSIVMQDMLWVRGRRVVKCSIPQNAGIPMNSVLCRKLEHNLCQPGPSIFLNDMWTAFKDYSDRTLDLGGQMRPRTWDEQQETMIEMIRERIKRGVKSAYLAEDVERFQKQRHIAISMLNLLNMQKLDRVLGDDEADFSTDHRFRAGNLQIVGGFESNVDPGSLDALSEDMERLWGLPYY
jgi:hypothetical protein